jgi:hypothetical protein
MVVSGAGCIDRYEASLWKVIDTGCIVQIKQGNNLPPHCLEQAQQVGIAGTDYTARNASSMAEAARTSLRWPCPV